MNSERKNSFLIPKREARQSPEVQMRAVLCRYFSRWFQRKEQVHFDQKSLKMLELKKFAKQIFWKYRASWCWTGCTKWKIFPSTRNSFFARQEADRLSTLKHSQENCFEIDAWAEPRNGECHFLSLELSPLCYALMNSIVLGCSRFSVSGGLKKRAGDEWGLVGKRRGFCLLPARFFDRPHWPRSQPKTGYYIVP